MVKKPWNAEVLCGPGPRREQAWLRVVYLLEIETQFPEVLTALKGSVYENWRTAAMLLYQNRTPTDIAAGMGRLWLWNHVESDQSSECRSAHDALDQWARRLGLACKWILDTAVDTMRFWSIPAQDGVNAENAADSEPIPLNEIEEPLTWDGLILHEMRRPRSPLVAWHPEEETLAAFRERVEGHIKKQQKWCRAMGWQPMKQRQKSRGRSIEVRMWWLALRKIKTLNCEEIADKEQERSPKEQPTTASGVLKAITELENQLELDPELSKRT